MPNLSPNQLLEVGRELYEWLGRAKNKDTQTRISQVLVAIIPLLASSGDLPEFTSDLVNHFSWDKSFDGKAILAILEEIYPFLKKDDAADIQLAFWEASDKFYIPARKRFFDWVHQLSIEERGPFGGTLTEWISSAYSPLLRFRAFEALVHLFPHLATKTKAGFLIREGCFREGETEPSFHLSPGLGE